ncbi:MAG: extracellular solute-binding protein [Candidatus Sumerlaeota bacterium]|nr:extracellular solute-binding protein [Candidatus Sumerlaeota bacterium]
MPSLRIGTLRIVFLSAFCAAAGAAFAASDAATTSARKIEVWSWNIAAASLAKCVPEFRKEHPDIEVFINQTGARMKQRFLLALSAGVGAPVVSQLEQVDVPQFSRTKRLADLTDQAAPYKDAFPPFITSICQYEGRLYAIPWDIGPCAVFYKPAVFERYGVNPDAIETWDEYIEAGKTIVEKSGSQTRMLCLGQRGGLSMMYVIMLQQVKGQIFDDAGRVAINSAESERILELIRKMLKSGICSPIAPFSPEYIAGFKDESLATYPIAVWFGGSVKDYAPATKGTWRVFRLPAVERGGLRVSNYGGSVLVIPEQIKGKDREAGWEFIQFSLCTDRMQIFQYENFDLFPCLMTTFKDPFFDAPDPFYGGQKVRRLFATDIEKIPPLNRTKDWLETVRYLDQTLPDWAANDIPTRDYLRTMEDMLCRKLRREIAPDSLSRKPESKK